MHLSLPMQVPSTEFECDILDVGLPRRLHDQLAHLVVRWCGGVVVRWCDGAMVRWCGGAVVHEQKERDSKSKSQHKSELEVHDKETQRKYTTSPTSWMLQVFLPQSIR